jgi:hypothetical protein
MRGATVMFFSHTNGDDNSLSPAVARAPAPDFRHALLTLNFPFDHS